MTGIAGFQPLDLVFLDQLQPNFFLILWIFVPHGEDLTPGPDVLLRIPMTIQTPPHLERILLVNQRHLIDSAVARFAAHALLHVNTVIEIDEIRKIVNFHPRNGSVISIAGAHHFQFRAARPDLRMAVHAGLGRRDIRISRVFYRSMAVAAIDAHRTDVMRVAKLHGLHPRHALVGGVRRIRAKLKQGTTDTGQREQADDDSYLRITVGTEVKNLRH